ncbi:NAD(P)-dependent oxidoreductase [Mucilaginibacter myungsuensis]|uniref:NAD(P)H-binding protein n=1 Tax=Mucilaginibacter myungsuensis TaxID=649104 RepID=A0A929KXI0_9SPHI|nr:NAD(P)H-binding protein [Mucilaginibacter myungsuensis]MBE9660719.1 NAD(P)H-binding protein [Mucilaginibacter myungsuensis]MDN3600764.1 NAD(P)H-binding protein [Mucilaginibacter myungsuensis]
MNATSNVALIGGTGRAGKYVLNNLLAKNIPVKLLYRNADTLTISHPLLQVIKGNARDADSILQLLQGCSAVISCLGQPAGEPPITDLTTGHILSAMQGIGIKRYIVLAGLNVDVSNDKKSLLNQRSTQWMEEHYPESCAARRKEYQLLNQSNADWSIVRIPMLIQTDELAEVTVSTTDCPGQQISSSSLAEFMADLLFSSQYIKQAPFIANS